MAQSSLFFGGYEDEKEKLENPIITLILQLCVGADVQNVRTKWVRCAVCGVRSRAAPHRRRCGTVPTADRKNQPYSSRS